MKAEMSMKLKVCGMREPQNIRELAQLHPDYMGLIFYPQSKRVVADLDTEMLQNLPASLKITGVFADETVEGIIEKCQKYPLKAIQLHGAESPEFCRLLRAALEQIKPAEPLELIKAFGLDEDFDFQTLEPYLHLVDFFLFDTKTAAHGGSGITFNWSVLDNYPYTKPYFLSGGLSAENLPEVNLIKDPRLYALDLNSRFEIAPGKKDIEKIKQALNNLKSR